MVSVVSQTEADILNYLWVNDGKKPSQGELTEQLLMNKNTIVIVLRKLQRRGLIHKERNGKGYDLLLTNDGYTTATIINHLSGIIEENLEAPLEKQLNDSLEDLKAGRYKRVA